MASSARLSLRAVLGLGFVLLAAGPASALAGGDIRGFERWLEHGQPHGNFKRLSDPGNPGVLFGGRVGQYDTIVRIYLVGGRIARQKVEVELPSDRSDDIALSIIARFFREFTGMRRNEDELWRVVQGLRGAIYRSGRKDAGVDFLGAHLSLHLDTQPNHDMINPERPTWGTLFWRAEARKLPPPRKK